MELLQTFLIKVLGYLGFQLLISEESKLACILKRFNLLIISSKILMNYPN